jgi:hypothetical protein
MLFLTFTLLDWDELLKEARLDYFHSLPKEEKSRIYTLPDPETREPATKELFCKLLNKPELDPDTPPA